MNQNEITMVDDVTGKIYECVVYSSKISLNKKYIDQGLYMFAKGKRLMTGDELEFTHRDPPEIKHVSLHNR